MGDFRHFCGVRDSGDITIGAAFAGLKHENHTERVEPSTP